MVRVSEKEEVSFFGCFVLPEVFFCCGDQYSLEVRNASSKKLYFLVGEPLRFRDDDERGEGSSLRSLPPDIRETIVLNRKINFLSVVSQLSNEWWRGPVSSMSSHLGLWRRQTMASQSQSQRCACCLCSLSVLSSPRRHFLEIIHGRIFWLFFGEFFASFRQTKLQKSRLH
mmetsp:Transcript_6131/g.20006  ORF Transcript_6131/g.20006 Transcript_6131/m.20006 type:complete len:171 (+) Transcript_6131:116-628(+)